MVRVWAAVSFMFCAGMSTALGHCAGAALSDVWPGGSDGSLIDVATTAVAAVVASASGNQEYSATLFGATLSGTCLHSIHK